MSGRVGFFFGLGLGDIVGFAALVLAHEGTAPLSPTERLLVLTTLAVAYGSLVIGAVLKEMENRQLRGRANAAKPDSPARN